MTSAQNNSDKGLEYVNVPLGCLCKLSAVEAIVYSYMLNRYWFFKKIGNEYYENIKDIAIATRQPEITIKRCISALKQKEHIDVSKRKAKIGNSNVYVVHDLYMLYTERPKLIDSMF